MPKDVDLYDGHYSQLAADLQSDVRRETYGEDLGQASWLTLDELRLAAVAHTRRNPKGAGGGLWLGWSDLPTRAGDRRDVGRRGHQRARHRGGEPSRRARRTVIAGILPDRRRESSSSVSPRPGPW